MDAFVFRVGVRVRVFDANEKSRRAAEHLGKWANKRYRTSLAHVDAVPAKGAAESLTGLFERGALWIGRPPWSRLFADEAYFDSPRSMTLQEITQLPIGFLHIHVGDGSDADFAPGGLVDDICNRVARACLDGINCERR